MSQVLRKSPSFHRGPRLTGNGEGGLAIPEHRIWMERAQNRHSGGGGGSSLGPDTQTKGWDGAAVVGKSLQPEKQEFVELLPGSGIKN